MPEKAVEKIVITGGKPLSGEITVSGAKNAVLPIIVGTLLSEETCELHDVPHLADVEIITEVLSSLGAKTAFKNGILTVDSSQVDRTAAPEEYIQKMRASVLILGPLLARFGKGTLSMPGGCAIGTRPIDLHLKGLEALGANIRINEDHIDAEVDGRLKGAKIFLRVPSVGATENLMMAATLAEGETIIENAAEEPEIVDLALFLNAMGAKIKGAGTPIIRIKGVERLKGCTHTIIPDRIEAGSYLLAGAITKGHIRVRNVIADHLLPVLEKLEASGAKIEVDSQAQTIDVWGGDVIHAVDIDTEPYPGFPTDMQAQFMAYLTLADGVSVFTENIFENRYMHVDELRKLGANIHVDNKKATVEGVEQLYGAEVKATDLRAGAALVIAGLAAEGETTVTNLYHIDRGYEDLIGKFQKLGADIRRIKAE